MIFPRCRNEFDFDIRTKLFSGASALALALLLVLTSIESEAVASQSKKIRIADLLTDRDDDGRLDLLGEQLTIRGRATVGTDVLNDQYLLFYMQDSTAGIMVFSDTLEVSISKGDSLQVTGTLEIHASKPEILVEDLVVLKPENIVPESQPLLRAFKNPERYRGLLVSGEAVVQDKNLSKDIKMFQISLDNRSDDSLYVFVSRANIHYEDFNFSTLEAGDPYPRHSYPSYFRLLRQSVL